MFGKLRRSDFLPVGPEQAHEITERGYESLESDDENGRGLEYAHSDQSDQDLLEIGEIDNMLLDVDFGIAECDHLDARIAECPLDCPLDLGTDYEAYVPMSCVSTSDVPMSCDSTSVGGEDYNLLDIDFM